MQITPSRGGADCGVNGNLLARRSRQYQCEQKLEGFPPTSPLEIWKEQDEEDSFILQGNLARVWYFSAR